MKLKKIKLTSSGPNKNYRKGQVIEVDEMRAELLIKEKHAICLDKKG